MDLYFLLEQLTPLILGSLGILTVGRIAIEKQRTRRGDNGRSEVSRDDLLALRERVQVLERAVVEPSRRLSREIDDLRD